MGMVSDSMATSPARREVLTRLVIVVFALLVLAIVGLLGWNSFQSAQTADLIRQTQLNGSPTLKRIEALAQEIEDCTQPGGECYRRSQSQTASAVGSINEITLLTVACSQDYQGIRAIQRCVVDAYADQHPEKG